MAQGQKKKKGISAKKSGSKRPLGPKKGGAQKLKQEMPKSVNVADISAKFDAQYELVSLNNYRQITFLMRYDYFT